MAADKRFPTVVEYDEWLTARRKLLSQEKELTRAYDRLNAERRRLPMVRVTKDYTFTGPHGAVGFRDLFDGRSQLIVHHFMLGPDDTEMCASCAAGADSIPRLRQLHARNTSLVAVSHAPYTTLTAHAKRMGWDFPWVSSHGSHFNYDFHATLDNRVAPVLLDYMTEDELVQRARDRPGYRPWSDSRNGIEWPWVTVFLRHGEDIFLTYSATARGIEQFHCGHPYLDLTPLGRREDWEEPKGHAEALGHTVGGPYRLPLGEYDQRLAPPGPWN